MCGSWDMEHSSQIFLSFWAIFCPITLLTTWKIKTWKKHEKSIWRYYHFTHVCHINDNHMIYFGPFLPFHPTNKLKNQNFEKMKKTLRYHHFTLVYNKWQSYDVQLLRYGAQQIEFFVILKKKWKKTLEISSFHTCVTQMTIIWCTASEIWKKTDIIFCHFEPVFAILPP